MEQMLRDLDLAIGKEILKLLPLKAGALAANEKADQVTGGSAGGLGLMVHRDYGTAPKTANIEIINNSPLINSIQSILTMPVIGGMVRDENQKVVKVQGYKSLLNRTLREDGKTDYELQVPMNNTLLTVRMIESSEGDITSLPIHCLSPRLCSSHSKVHPCATKKEPGSSPGFFHGLSFLARTLRGPYHSQKPERAKTNNPNPV